MDRSVYFNGGCHWILAWEKNVGARLGAGLVFLIENRPTPAGLNFAFAKQPFQQITLRSELIDRRQIRSGCTYVVYAVEDEKLHYVYMNENKSQYEACIARSVIEFAMYNEKPHFTAGGEKIELLALGMLLARSPDFTVASSDAVASVEEIMSWRR